MLRSVFQTNYEDERMNVLLIINKTFILSSRAELGSRVRGGKISRFVETHDRGGRGAIQNVSETHSQGQPFPVRGGKVTHFRPFNRQIFNLTLRTLAF